MRLPQASLSIAHQHPDPPIVQLEHHRLDRPVPRDVLRFKSQREPIPGLVYEYALTQQLLPGITLAEVNALAKNWTPDLNQ